jgi:hypothetical protein
MADEMGYESIDLKPFEERFCWKYVELGIGVKAYQALKPKSKYGTARTEASNLLTNPDIKARIAQIQEEIGREAKALVMGYHKTVMTTDRIALLHKVRTAESLNDLDEDARKILEFEQVNSKDGIRTLLKVPTRHQSAVELSRIMGMNKDKVELEGDIGLRHSGTIGVSEDIQKMNALREKFGLPNGEADTTA